MGNSLKTDVLKTIVYADIFDYPLTEDEIWQFLISDIRIPKQVIGQAIKKLKIIESKKGFYCLEKRTNIIEERIKRKIYSKKKISIAHKISSYISFIPTVSLIGISGGLAMENANMDDDIDLFVVVKKDTVWLTRLFTLIVLEVFGARRKRGDINVANKICLNMIVDETYLSLPKAGRNLYTAHEVVQMRPIFERGDMYKKFIMANNWVEKFLPNALPEIRNQKSEIRNNKINSLFILEAFAKRIQLLYMRRHKKMELISNTALAFYPLTYQSKILKKYESKLQNIVTYEKI